MKAVIDSITIVLFLLTTSMVYCTWNKFDMEKLKDLVRRIDKNDDNRIDRSELQMWIVRNLKKSISDQGTAKFKSYDNDGDKKISWKEYLVLHYRLSPHDILAFKQESNPSNHTKRFIKKINFDERRFKVADMNGNKKLESHEFCMFIFPRMFPYMAHVEVDEILDTYDNDGDGFVDLKEFINSDHSEENAEKEVNLFRHYDANHDGKLDKIELWKWVMPGIDQVALHEALQLFDYSAKQRGIKEQEYLVASDLVSCSDKWFSSLATSYGEDVLSDYPYDEL